MKPIKTSTTALYEQGLISYSPAKKHLEMIFGTNTSKYDRSLYDIKLQNKNTFEIGIMKKGKERYYCPERLFIELNKFKLEATIKNEALKNLKDNIDPTKTKKIYNLLKGKRRGLNDEQITKFLESNLLNIKEKIKIEKDRKMLMREYIIALVSRKNVPVSIIKGGSAVELFTTINRSTLDIDVHTDKNSIVKIIDFLKNKELEIYFKISNKENSLLKDKIASNWTGKKIFKFNLIPISRGGVVAQELKDIIVPVTFNTTYSNDEIEEMIKSYKITHRNLRILKNASCLIFTREMLLAEKFKSLISKPNVSTRSKDLIDLKLIWKNNINFNDFRKWLFRKWENQRNPSSKNEAKKIIQRNKDIPLTKIEEKILMLPLCME